MQHTQLVADQDQLGLVRIDTMCIDQARLISWMGRRQLVQHTKKFEATRASARYICHRHAIVRYLPVSAAPMDAAQAGV